MLGTDLSELGELLSGEAFAGWVVRGVDDDNLGLGCEGGSDGERVVPISAGCSFYIGVQTL